MFMGCLGEKKTQFRCPPRFFSTEGGGGLGGCLGGFRGGGVPPVLGGFLSPLLGGLSWGFFLHVWGGSLSLGGSLLPFASLYWKKGVVLH